LVFLVLLAVVGVVLSQSTSIVRWWFHTFEVSLEPRLPADLTAGERQGLHRAFEAAARDIGKASGDGGVQQLEAFQHELMKLSNPQTPITRRDVLELTDVLNGLAGRPTPPRGAAPPTIPSAPSPSSPPGASSTAPPTTSSPGPGAPGSVPPPSPAPTAPPGAPAGGGAEIPPSPRA
jgi:hypothetical protein